MRVIDVLLYRCSTTTRSTRIACASSSSTSTAHLSVRVSFFLLSGCATQADPFSLPSGSALLGSIARVNGQKTWPTFVIESSNTSTPAEVQQRVFDGEFWGGIWSSSGATERFEQAISSSASATSYDASQAIFYTGNEVRYNTVRLRPRKAPPLLSPADIILFPSLQAWAAFVLAPLTRIVQGAVSAFGRETVAPLVATGRSFSSESASVLANPIAASFVNLVPFDFGSRIVFNTIGFVFPSLFQFFVRSFHALARRPSDLPLTLDTFVIARSDGLVIL